MRILLAEQPGLFRDAVRALLESEFGSVDEERPVIEEVSTLDEARRAVCSSPPGIAIVSIDLAPSGGFCATEAIAEAAPSCRIVLMADRDDQVLLLRGVRSGARGFVVRNASLAQLLAAIRAAVAKQAYVPPGMLEDVLLKAAGRPVEANSPAARVERLTERERQVLIALASGQGNRILGEQLGISPHTARTHVQNLLPKLGVHSRLEAAAIARQSGLLEPSNGEVAS